jgi:deoxyxylulose-5-phosphate synthase
MVSTGEHVRQKLKERGLMPALWQTSRFVKPLDYELLDRIASGKA